MLTIKFVLSGKECKYEYSDDQREIANAFVKALKEDNKCTSIMCIRPNGEILQIKKESQKCFAIQVVFKSSDKRYTYGSKIELLPNDEAVVYTWNGLEVVKVVECTKIEESALQGLCNGKKPMWIQGKFIRF